MEMDSKVVLIETAKSTASILYFKNHLFEISSHLPDSQVFWRIPRPPEAPCNEVWLVADCAVSQVAARLDCHYGARGYGQRNAVGVWQALLPCGSRHDLCRTGQP